MKAMADQRRYFLTFVELDMAVNFWRLGLDTYDIALKFRVHESAVFNALREYREKRRTAA